MVSSHRARAHHPASSAAGTANTPDVKERVYRASDVPAATVVAAACRAAPVGVATESDIDEELLLRLPALMTASMLELNWPVMPERANLRRVRAGRKSVSCACLESSIRNLTYWTIRPCQ